MKLIHRNFEIKKSEVIKIIEQHKILGNKYSITSDEWTSLKRRRYLNINLHGENDVCVNLGLVPISGSCNADDMVDKVKYHLLKFKINFESDIVCTTHDGAPMMLKYGRTCPAEMIICLNHSIHLGVCDYLYKQHELVDDCATEPEPLNEDEDLDEYEDDFQDFEYEPGIDNYVDENITIFEHLKLVRKIVCFFRYSPVRNSILQNHVRNEFEREYELLLDMKVRWNSISPMIERFLKLKTQILQALTDLNAHYLMDKVDLELLKNLNHSLQPIILAVEALSRKDANIFGAEGVLSFLKNKMEAINSEISRDLLKSIENRIGSRKNDNITALIKCLVNPTSTNGPTKSTLSFASALMKRLFPAEYSEAEEEVLCEESAVIVESEIELAEELNSYISKASNVKEVGISNDSVTLKQEFNTFKKTSMRTKNLELLYMALKTAKPTSTDSERTFSVSGNFCTKIRSRLSCASLNALVFLKYYYLNEKMQKI